MAETVVKTIENIDELFSQIVVNGEVHQSTRYVPPVTTQAQTSSPSQSTQTSTDTEAVSDTPVRQTQGQDVYGVELNDVLHDFVDQRVTQALEEEVTAREDADTQLQTNIDNEEMARQQADYGLGQRVTAIEEVIPNQATPSNQLADKAFVNSSIATNTANFLGTYTSLTDIEAIPNPTNNDYVFLEITDASGNSGYDRYKYNAEQDEWLFEYELNNSSFTAEQWATINSGLTQSSVSSDIESAVEALDVSAVGGSGKYIKQISQTDGVITAVTGDITSSITSGSNDPVTSGAVADALANIDVEDAETAEKLKTARNLKVALGSTTAQSFDGSANAESIGVSGTLPVANGGTGQTTAKDACNSFINALDTGSSTPTDNDYYVSQYVNGGTTTTTYHRRPMSALWNYIKGKIQSIALTIGSTASAIAETLYGSITVKNSSDVTTASISQAGEINGVTLKANGYQLKRAYTINASSLSSSNFYPVTFDTSDLELDCEVHSPSLSGSASYNQNYIHFQLIAQGWNDTPKRLNVLQYGVYDANEITIGCIGIGNQGGINCIWIRGGLSYRFYCNREPTLRTSDYTNGNEKFTVGTNYDGGTNAQVNILFTPNGVNSARFSGTLFATLTGNVTGNCSGSSGSCTGNSATADTTRGTAYCTTASATQAKVASMRGFVLQSGATFPITFTNANTYDGVITLNVNSTGAKNIYINNAVSSSSNKTLPAGTYLCRYNGSYYYIDTGYFVTNARNANYASSAGSATDAYTIGSGRGAVNGYYIEPSYDSTNNWVKMSGHYGTGSSNTRNSCVDVALKIRTSAPSSPSDGDIWIQ